MVKAFASLCKSLYSTTGIVTRIVTAVAAEEKDVLACDVDETACEYVTLCITR